MNSFKFLFIILVCILAQTTHGQTDSINNVHNFTGSVGITNNGFSIVPTFSLNSPAAIMNFSWRKKRFSFNPDIRLVTDASKGGFLFWFRYQAIQQKRLGLRLSVHPAFSLVRKTINDNGNAIEITEMLRFLAYEIAQNYQITPHWKIGVTYLQGNALQHHGPQLTQVVFLNTSVTDIPLVGDFRFQISPSYYFLSTDNYTGNYLAATIGLSKKECPFALQYTINHTFNSTIPDNKAFMWNVLLSYQFSKNFKRI